MRRRLSGSVLVYVLLIVIAIGSIAIALVAMVGQQYSAETIDEQSTRAQLAFEGALSQGRYYTAVGTVAPPYSSPTTIGSFTINATLSDNSASLAGTAKLDLNTSRWGRTFTKSYVFGNAGPISSPTLWNYAVLMNSSTGVPKTLTTNDAYDATGAHVYANPYWSETSNGTIQGNVYLTGSGPADSNVSVSSGHTKYYNQTVLPWPKLQNNRYKNAATTVYNTGTTIVNPTSLSGTPLYYVNGDLHISGTLNGTLTYYATGDIYMDNSISDTSGTDALVLITPKTVYTYTGSKSYAAYMFCDTFCIRAASTISRGVLACRQITYTNAQNLAVYYDPTIKNNPALGASLHMPGLWP